MEKLFLLDAYALIYRAYYALIRTPRINSKGLNTSAILGFVNTLEYVLNNENPTHIGIAFDPSGKTFRHEMYEPYKAQRESTPEDIKLSVPIIKKIIEAYNIPILEVAGFEADDVIGTLSHQADEKGIQTFMLTPDKDYGQLVTENVKMFRPKHTGGYEIMGIEEVKKKFGIENTDQVIDFLGLMGDASDNIPGCPGVGEKTAQKIISEFGSIENLLNSTEQLKGALKKKVEENKELISLSRVLATIRKDVPITLDMENLKIAKPNEEELRKLFEELEFSKLLNKVLGVKPKSVEKGPIQGDLFSGFAADVQEEKAESKQTTLSDIEHKYILVDNQEIEDNLLRNILSQKEVCFDTETTGTDPMNADIVGMSFSFAENEAYYVPLSQNRDEAQTTLNKFKPFFENEEIGKVGQNMKYDMLVLMNYGIKVKGKMFDTMVAHYVIQPELRHNMDYMASTLLNYTTIHIEEIIGAKGKNQKNMRDLSPNDVYEYACEDADVTLKLKNILADKLKEKECEELFYNIEMPLVPVLTKMEYDGVCLDTESLKESAKRFTEELINIEKEITELAGQEFNISSPKQVGEILFDKMKIVEKPKKTKTGQYVTSEEVLQSLKGKHKIVERILDYRGLKKLLSTYIEALPELINPRTGKIHTSFNQTVTVTGRLSSSNPNLQNIPIRDDNGKEIRKAFIPEEGCQFFSADYSQIELRIMAHLSGDANMIESFNEGLDIHAATAAKIYKKDVSEVTKTERSKSKTANFGIIYGISVFGLAERMMVPRAEAKELIDGYFATFPSVKEYMNKSIEVAREKMYTETIFKRRCYLPDINSGNSVVRGYAERNAINAPIQGSAADIVKVAMINIYNRFEREGIRSKMILQVHDELNFSVYPDEKEKVEQIVIEEMENAYKMKVPLKADCGWGKNWLEAH
ncbi:MULTISPECIES: DNA polymerase I [unclassified Bacteroides]|uniref:DNA polymerase I n=1 Tax=unclassified Bacteroides TaxID=2646097 RepID=UPI0004E0E900|nr:MULTISPECIES: DNA polymerase I [unclassified Bacteroides]